MTETKVVAFVGSLRKDSLNRKLFNSAVQLAPAGMTIDEIAGWKNWPILDRDDIDSDGIPQAVADAGALVLAADALLFVSPEYNYSIPGGLKNAIDWVSLLRPVPFAGKTAAIMGASPGRFGTARMQYHLRQTLVFLDAHPLNKPEVMVAAANEAFAEDGQLIDERTRLAVAGLLANLATFAGRFEAIGR